MTAADTDPVATAAPHEQELAALELTEHPTVRAAYRDVAEKWLSRAKPSDTMRERFDDAFTEVMFSAAVWSSNQDKLRPKVSCITRLGHPVGESLADVGAEGVDGRVVDEQDGDVTVAFQRNRLAELNHGWESITVESAGPSPRGTGRLHR